ncbi:MAG TPA: family 1 glycosylhydrolase [Gemmatimonadaceae bacterium]|nr:family 1 glycosylhydrolase [Gemmatimonadaceae bacterium]
MSGGGENRLDAPALWGGVECTINRVGDQYFDQLELSGHASRASDIELIAGLGLKTVRYPLLWERISPGSGKKRDWAWADDRMNRMSRHGIDPIVGLVHHGSGPESTSLLDPDFPMGLARYALEVAKRYPHIRYATPVNEPLTTARFSALYGHWYPHKRSPSAFATALLNQCLAIRESCAAMRSVIPGMQLVQTEDIGRIYSTPSLEYQARFENERRWLTFDLLCGRVDATHPMWKHLAVDGAASAMLEALVARPCPPDIIGLNYYVTSERFLDERTGLYDASRLGGNGRDRYIDAEAVRVVEEEISGHAAILGEAWARYGIPLALTEVHLGCSREHQMRWLKEAWDGAIAARRSGCDVRAVTAWALFGSFGWDSLVTAPPLTYESGAFDVRAPRPRETGIASLIRKIVSTGDADHPVADQPGWWRRRERIMPEASVFVGSGGRVRTARMEITASLRKARPVLITGASGTLGSAFERICNSRGIHAVALSRAELDVCATDRVTKAIETLRPWAVINAAGYVRVDDAETDRASCYRGNTVVVGVLAGGCALAGIPLLTFSSDLVFDGAKTTPYVESDRVSPLNTYGASKAAAEIRALHRHPDSLVIRTSAFFGPWDACNFVSVAISTLAKGIPFTAARDVTVSPTYVPDLVNAALDLLVDGATGVWHLANAGEITWSDLARVAAERANLSPDLVREAAFSDLGRIARQPYYSALGTERGVLLPTLEDAIGRYFAEASLPSLHPIAACP